VRTNASAQCTDALTRMQRDPVPTSCDPCRPPGNEALRTLLHRLRHSPETVIDSRIDDAERSILCQSTSVKQFLTRLALLPFAQQQAVLRAFLSKIASKDTARAEQLQSTSVVIRSESTVFNNPRNAAEQVTLTEIECDNSCS
jgi:hypothetical protein